MTNTIRTTGFAAFSTDPNALGVMYGYGRTEEDAREDAARYCNENAADGRRFTSSDFVAYPATDAVADAAGDEVETVEIDGEEIVMTVWEAKEAR